MHVDVGDIQCNAVAGSAQLIGEGGLLEVRESTRCTDALDREALGVLPRLESFVVGHRANMNRKLKGTASNSRMPCLSRASLLESAQRLSGSAAWRLPRTRRLGGPHPSNQLFEVRPLARHQYPHPIDPSCDPGHPY